MMRSPNPNLKRFPAVENPKWFGVSTLVLALSLCVAVAQAQQAKIPRLGFLIASSAPVQKPRLEAFREGLRELGYVEGKNISIEYRLRFIGVRGANDLENAFAAISAARSGAILTLSDPVTFTLLKRIVELTIKHRVPSMHLQAEYADAGGMVAYGPSYAELYRRAATYVDKILKRTAPADLPVEQPRRFELVENLKTAKQIGVTIPPNLLVRADRVIR